MYAYGHSHAAEQTFLTYERTSFRIIPGGDTATIVMRMAVVNYVNFKSGAAGFNWRKK